MPTSILQLEPYLHVEVEHEYVKPEPSTLEHPGDPGGYEINDIKVVKPEDGRCWLLLCWFERQGFYNAYRRLCELLEQEAAEAKAEARM